MFTSRYLNIYSIQYEFITVLLVLLKYINTLYAYFTYFTYIDYNTQKYNKCERKIVLCLVGHEWLKNGNTVGLNEVIVADHYFSGKSHKNT